MDPVSRECILTLTSEEIKNVFILVSDIMEHASRHPVHTNHRTYMHTHVQFKTIPLGTSAHGLGKPAMSESDPVYHQLLNRIGFSNWRGKLIYERELGYSGLDKITLAIIAIHSVTSITLNH